MILTDYRGEDLVTAFTTYDFDLYCPNDDCPGLTEAVEDGEVVEVERVAWGGGWRGATGPSYSSGGEVGCYDRPECPECGEAGESL